MSPDHTSPTSVPDADALNERSLALMALVKTGDHNAFNSLVQLHQSSVLGAAYRMLGSQEDAQDLAQQVFVRIWKSAPALRGQRQVHHVDVYHFKEPGLQ